MFQTHQGHIYLCPTLSQQWWTWASILSYWTDVGTKPLQSAKFHLMLAFLMNFPIDYSDDQIPTSAPTSNPTVTKSSSSTVCPTTFVPSDNPTYAPMKANPFGLHLHPGGVLRHSLLVLPYPTRVPEFRQSSGDLRRMWPGGTHYIHVASHLC